MIAKVPTLAAMAYKYSIGQPFIYPDNSLNYTENFLKMCFAVPAETFKVNKVFARALDKILFYMQIMNKMHLHQQLGWQHHQGLIHLHQYLQDSHPYGVHCMVCK